MIEKSSANPDISLRGGGSACKEHILYVISALVMYLEEQQAYVTCVRRKQASRFYQYITRSIGLFGI